MVYDNVVFVLEVIGKCIDVINWVVFEVFEMVGLFGKVNWLLDELLGGE